MSKKALLAIVGVIGLGYALVWVLNNYAFLDIFTFVFLLVCVLGLLVLLAYAKAEVADGSN